MSLRDAEHRGATSLAIDQLEELFRREMSAGLTSRLLAGNTTTFGDPRGTPYAKARRDPADAAVLADVPLTRTGGTFVHLYVLDRGSYRTYQLYAIGYGPVSVGAQGRRLIAQFEEALDIADTTRRPDRDDDGVVPGLRAIARNGDDLGEITNVVSTLIDVEGAIDADGAPITRVFRSDLDLVATRATGARDGQLVARSELVPGLRAIGRNGEDYGEITSVVSTIITVEGAKDVDGEPITRIFRSDLDLAATLATARPALLRDNGVTTNTGTANGGAASPPPASARSSSASTGGAGQRSSESTSSGAGIDTSPWSTEQFREIAARLAERGIEPTVRDGHLFVSERARPAAMRVIGEILTTD